MKNKYVLGLIGLAIIVGAGYWLYSNNIFSTTSPININGKKSQNSMSNNQKTYSVSNADLSVLGAKAEFNHILKPGKSTNVFIVMLPNNQYLITKFSWLVIPSPTATQEEGSTYLFTGGKFTPVKADLAYVLPDGALDGKISWPTENDPNGFITIHSEPGDMVSINSAGEFKQITSLPGFENAVYKE